MEDDTFGKIVILTFEDTEEQIMNRILSYLDDEVKIIQYGSVYNRKLSFDGLHIDKHKRTVIREDNEIELTYTEFEILLLLAQNIGKVFSKEQISSLERTLFWWTQYCHESYS